MIGATLQNRYRIDAELGRGGMGVVYRAHDSLLNRPVAVKMLSSAGLGTEGRARLLREARAAAQLDHPNIVTVYDAGETDGSPFIVMQLVEGPSLRDRPPGSLDEALAIARQVCEALDHAHTRGVVHRDLKPENILITPDGAAKLMDFGLARSVASQLTMEGALVGSVHYMAPEQALGQAVDGRADLYALGVMLYELAAGRLPFEAGDPISVISQHLNAPVVPPRAYNEALSPALDALIVRLLSKQADDRPASAAEVLWALDHVGSPEAAAGPAIEISLLDRIVRGRLVGRERELAEARGRWERAASGEGQVLLVSGEPGIGKTRLVRELTTHVEVSGGVVLSGECYAEGAGPYGPIAQAISGVANSVLGLPSFVLADLTTIAPALRARFPDLPPNPPLDPDSEQERLYESVVTLFSTQAERAPLLWVIEDVHWADAGTLFLVRRLARRLRRQPVLILCTYREVELDEARPLHELLLELNRERLATRLKLTRLNREHTRDLLAAIFAEETTPDFLDGIYRETEGNPFFVEEVCKTLIESGKLSFEGGRWHRPSMDELEIPQSLRVAIQWRVGRLPEPAQETLRLAAVFGREFDYAALANASELDEEGLITALEAAERAQLIAEVGGARDLTYAFAHALIPATLAEGLSALRRRRLHRRAAEAIRALRPDDDEALARHYAAAADRPRAVEHARRAARRAEAVFAYDVAFSHLSTALDLVEEAEHDATRLALLEELADVRRMLGEKTQAIETYQAALKVWLGLEGAAKLTAVRLHRKIINTIRSMALFADRQRFETARRASLEAGLQLIEGEAPNPETARLLTALSFDAWYWGPSGVPELEAAEGWATQAAQMAEQLGQAIPLSAALGALATAYGGRGLFRERVQVSLRRLALSRDPAFGDLRERVDILNQTGSALCSVGEYGQGLPHLEEAERVAAEIQDVDQQTTALRYQAVAWLRLDRWEALLEAYEKTLVLERRYPHFFEQGPVKCFFLGLVASVHALRGDFERAARLRQESQSIMIAAEGPPDRWGRSNRY